MAIHSLKLGTYLVESLAQRLWTFEDAQTPILTDSFTPTFKLQPKWTRIEPSSFLYPIHDGTDRGLTLKPRSPLLGETEKRPIDAPAFLPPTSIFI